MIRYVGVDGCRRGWFAVGFGKDKNWEIGLFQDINSLHEYYKRASLILIDIPIGLKDKRLCDVEARKLLGRKRASSIFPVPCRPALRANSYKEACLLNRKLCGRSISKQAWQIIAKIREVDDFIRCSKRSFEHLRETHPELCFFALAGCPMKYGKKTMRGFKERLRVLRMAFSGTDDIIDEAKRQYLRRDLALDDVMDAIAIALVTKRRKLISIPKKPEYDSCGVRMEIICAMP